MTVDGANLTNDALGLKTLAYGPARASLVDTGNAAAVKVAVGVGILVREAGLVDDVVRGHLLGAKKVGDRGDPANSCRSGDRGPRVAGTVGEREREVEKDRVKCERRIRLEGTREGF